ncbi:hypothetical protein ACFY05_06560 [Microtetraspora fusca]|uniref:Uncharacterized protein n=1 Tax=Microtetraspora fusca TaxID=1997 RepID=A0ABW6UZM1_MICFU
MCTIATSDNLARQVTVTVTFPPGWKEPSPTLTFPLAQAARFAPSAFSTAERAAASAALGVRAIEAARAA